MEINERIKMHSREPIIRKLIGKDGIEDEFKFKPLPNKFYVELMYLSEGKGKDDILNKEEIIKLFDLLEELVRRSYPDWDAETVENFVNYHFNDLLIVLKDLHGGSTSESAITKVKELQKKKREKDGQGNDEGRENTRHA